MNSPQTSLVSLFSGALGLDLGLELAGFKTIAVSECDSRALSTIETNLHFLQAKSPLLIREKLSLKNIKNTCEIISDNLAKYGEISPTILSGAPPCQPFSTVGKRLSIKDERATGFDIMFEAIRLLKPSYFIIENVSGVLSAALKHRPLNQRGPGFPPLGFHEQYGSAFKRILKDLGKVCTQLGYCATWGILNAADFGVPQKRNRLVIIGSREGYSLWPLATHSASACKPEERWQTLKSALTGLKETDPVYEPLTPKLREFMAYVPPGSNWRSLPDSLKQEALGNAFQSWGGRSGFLRRLSWDEPSPTVTNSPLARATMLCHPALDRPLSVRECARLQGFPDYWTFAGGKRDQFLQIGNATPVGLAQAIGASVATSIQHPPQDMYPGKVFCAQPELIAKICARPRTKLNPGTMRPGSEAKKDREWLGKAASRRSDGKLLKVRPVFTSK